MPPRKVTLFATERVFVGLSKQNLLFHQCVNELCDNAIAAVEEKVKAFIDVMLVPDPNSSDSFDLYVCDKGCGMGPDDLEQALQLGAQPTSNSRLNEHGFGLKNALATLSGGNGKWTIWSKKRGGKKIVHVEGPFRYIMDVNEDAEFPTDSFLTQKYSTIVKVNVKKEFARRGQGRGAASKLTAFRSCLVEHLGVSYRGFLQLNSEQETSAKITVSDGTDIQLVQPIEVPLITSRTESFKIELGGTEYTLIYRYGTLDKEKEYPFLNDKKLKFYYQGDLQTQGIDIRLGNRVIATRLLGEIWKTKKDDSPLIRHNSYNDFVGELTIPETLRGVLSTVNNKTNFDDGDPDWKEIFESLNRFPPIEGIREATESDIKKKWLQRLKSSDPEDEITDEHSVWLTGTRIDVFRTRADGKIIIYEIKTRKGEPLHLYQLKMYWDGLLMENIQPQEAVLIVKDYDNKLESMAKKMNSLPTLKVKGKDCPYKFKIQTLKECGLE